MRDYNTTLILLHHCYFRKNFVFENKLLNFLFIILLVMISQVIRRTFAQAKPNPFQKVASQIQAAGKSLTYYNIQALNDPRLDKLPFSIRVLLESAVRNCDEF